MAVATVGWLSIFALPAVCRRAGRTPRQALLDAIALIDKSKLHRLVLNDAHAPSGDGCYTHYGYSGYGAPQR